MSDELPGAPVNFIEAVELPPEKFQAWVHGYVVHSTPLYPVFLAMVMRMAWLERRLEDLERRDLIGRL